MSGKQLTRRTFIKAAGATGVSVYVLWSGPGIGSWLGKETLALARQLFPHDKLGDEFYWVVVESIDRDMAGSPELASRLRDGLARLNKAAGGDFTAVSADVQVEAMKKLEGTPFFSDMLNKTQFYFYNNKAVWSKFGYEGSSWEKGGYINRGFNDVKWTQG